MVTAPFTFGAFVLLFPDIAARMADKRGKNYEADRFAEELAPIFESLRKSQLPGASSKQLYEELSQLLKVKKLRL